MQLAANEVDGGSDDQKDSPADTLGFYGSESLTHSSRRSADARVVRALGERADQVHFVAAPNTAFTTDDWWQSEYGFTFIMLEYIKVVRYWAMSPVGGTAEPRNEVDAVRWVGLAEAAGVLTYEADLTLLKTFSAIVSGRGAC